MSPLSSFLAGVRILDLSQYIPGPFASLMLADMGADVIKVEPPGGDPIQTLGPRDREGRPLFYNTLNAGKSVLKLDLKQSGDLERCLSLVDDCDVLVEGFRPGVIKRLGLDYERLAALNPKLVYCSISGYGARGPDTQRAGHDANYLAEAGVLDRNGLTRPVFFDPPIADFSGSLFAAIAILGALHGRHRTGRGCQIDLGLADVIMPLQMLQIADCSENGSVPRRGETYLNGGAAFYNVYETRDGAFVVLGAVEPKFWRTFSEAAGYPEWIARQNEPMPQTELINDVAARLNQLTLSECLDRFAADDCCVSPVLSIDQALAASRIADRGLVKAGADGVLQSLFPAWIDGKAPATRVSWRTFDERAPGQDNQEN